uniref:Uncharacterized protein n=1 Tax=Corvus moneduloides TaxID=1196302 RepID=A0A8U7NLD7_CORMO
MAAGTEQGCGHGAGLRMEQGCGWSRAAGTEQGCGHGAGLRMEQGCGHGAGLRAEQGCGHGAGLRMEQGCGHGAGCRQSWSKYCSRSHWVTHYVVQSVCSQCQTKQSQSDKRRG